MRENQRGTHLAIGLFLIYIGGFLLVFNLTSDPSLMDFDKIKESIPYQNMTFTGSPVTTYSIGKEENYTCVYLGDYEDEETPIYKSLNASKAIQWAFDQVGSKEES